MLLPASRTTARTLLLMTTFTSLEALAVRRDNLFVAVMTLFGEMLEQGGAVSGPIEKCNIVY